MRKSSTRHPGSAPIGLAVGLATLGLLAFPAIPGLSAPSGPAAAAAQAPPTGYLDHDALTEALRQVTEGSDVAALRSLGSSLEGRDVWMVEVASRGGAPVDERPGVLVVGTLSGDHVVGSHLALEVVRHLTANASDPDVRAVLDDRVVYVVPRLNPDGAEAMFADVVRDRRGNARPHDDDNDGRIDGDGPEDLDGDGMITVMRVPEAGGRYMVHPDDPRRMKMADRSRGETGTHALYPEGIDSDGDGFLNEDGPGGVDLDRNFQHAYPYWEADAGVNMVSEPESRALMDFVIGQRNIAAILVFGHSDNLVTPPDQGGDPAPAVLPDLPAFADAADDDVFATGVFGALEGDLRGSGGSDLRGAQPGRDNDPQSGQRPVTSVASEDRPYFERASELYRELTGIDAVLTRRVPEGAFHDYGYFHFGVPSFSTPGWGIRGADAGGEAAGSGDAESRILGAAESLGLDAFVPWTAHSHPALGEVEIGGFRPYALANPPASSIPALGEAHGAFVVRLADLLPRVRIAEAEVTAHGGGVFTVEAVVENAGYFPTSLQHGVVCRCVDPTTVRIGVEPAAIVTGDDKSATIPRLEGSGARERFTWVVRGRSGQDVEITVRAQKGGTDATTVTLR